MHARDSDTHSESSFINRSNPSVEGRAVKHWLWDNWVLLSLCAAVVWAACNLCVGELADEGISGIFYFNTGSLIFTAGYFIKQRCDAKPSELKHPSIWWFIAGAILQGLIILAI